MTGRCTSVCSQAITGLLSLFLLMHRFVGRVHVLGVVVIAPNFSIRYVNTHWADVNSKLIFGE